MARISIILPTYNGAAYLVEQVSSIQQQSLRDWRMLVCDDGSSDDTVAVTAALAAGDPRIAVVPARGNIGQRRRLQQLAQAADTELIAVADQDDIWAPDKLELLLDALGDADLCFGASWLIDGEGHAFGRDIASSLRPAHMPGERLTLLARPLVSAHATLARRALFGAATFARIEPFDWLMSVEAAWGKGFHFVPAAHTQHRLHGGNQNNGFLAATPARPRLVSRSAWRTVAQVVRKQRFHLMAMLEHLSFADTLPAERRATARAAWQACHDGWYAPHAGTRRASARVRQELEALLHPIAGSTADWHYFARYLDHLCLPFHAPARFAARRARLALEWPE